MPHAPDQQSSHVTQAARCTEPKTLLQKAALVLQWLTFGCIVVAGLFLVPRAGLALFGALFALGDAAGAPGASGFHFLDGLWFAAWFLWLRDAPLLELLGILIASLIVTHILYRIRFYAPAIVVALAVFVVAAPFAFAEIYFTKSGASLPQSASLGVNVLAYRTLSTDPRVEGRFGLDNKHVYCSGDILRGANPETFVLVPSGTDSLGHVLEGYAKDDQHVWWTGNEIPNADPASIKVMSGNEHVREAWASAYATDSRAVYFQGKVIPNADPSSYVLLPDIYAKDKSHVWSGLRLIPEANPATFQILDYNSHCYLKQNKNCPPDARDDKQSYLHGQVIGQVQ